MTTKDELKSELVKQAQYQDLDVTDINLENTLDWITGTCSVNGSVCRLPKVNKLANFENWVTSFLANFPNSMFNPVPKFRRIEKGFCPDCDDKLSERGYCPPCHIIPALDPDYQKWLQAL